MSNYIGIGSRVQTPSGRASVVRTDFETWVRVDGDTKDEWFYPAQVSLLHPLSHLQVLALARALAERTGLGFALALEHTEDALIETFQAHPEPEFAKIGSQCTKGSPAASIDIHGPGEGGECAGHYRGDAVVTFVRTTNAKAGTVSDADASLIAKEVEQLAKTSQDHDWCEDASSEFTLKSLRLPAATAVAVRENIDAKSERTSVEVAEELLRERNERRRRA